MAGVFQTKSFLLFLLFLSLSLLEARKASEGRREAKRREYFAAKDFLTDAYERWGGSERERVADRERLREPYNCPPLPPRPTPTNIRDVSPADIGVILAVGDSITTGFGVMGFSGLFNEYRGYSFTVGGDPGAITLANYIRNFSPNLTGDSHGVHIAEICESIFCPSFQYEEKLDRLNAAQSGAEVDNVPEHEMNYILTTVKKTVSPERIKNDWKVMSVFIGMNDICENCIIANYWPSPDHYEKKVRDTLERIRTGLPRTIVNIITLLNASGAYWLTKDHAYCAELHEHMPLECACVWEKGEKGEKNRFIVDDWAAQYNERLRKIVKDYEQKDYPDFALIFHPFAPGTNISALPFGFVSTFDCFHPSKMAHESMAVALWNGMLTPADKRATSLNLSDKPICPDKNSRFYLY